MEFWLLSILSVVAVSIVAGYAVYGISKLFKNLDADSGKFCGVFSGISIGVVGGSFIFFSMFNSCSSRFTSFEESFLDSMPYLLIITGLIIVYFIWYIALDNRKNKQTETEDLAKDSFEAKDFGLDNDIIIGIDEESARSPEVKDMVDEVCPSAPKGTENIRIEVKGVEDDEKELIELGFKLPKLLVDGVRHRIAVVSDEAGPCEYADKILTSSLYPLSWGRSITIERRGEVLIINYRLPSIDDIPDFLEITYKKEQPVVIAPNEKRVKELWTDISYQITLRSLYELFASSMLTEIDAIAFNGIVKSLDTATGHVSEKCVLSVMAKRDPFMRLDFSRIDPIQCFKRLKGIAAHDLASLTPIPPIMNLNRKDKRFIASTDVLNDIDAENNLAAMDWKDFENLIRELFEKEFSSNGGEVKITRASKDGGVDAVVFDPDPIRGGKIIIQAKRYTNVVGVSAVRDLYGTVHNEGAIKGILVTTSDYGSDSYNFAKDKPLTLLNGANLLHLMSKHGYKASINIAEAKRILKDTDHE